MAACKFIFPGVTLSQNELDGKHWSTKHKQKEYWHRVVGYIARQCHSEVPRAHVHIVRVSHRLIDPLNCYAGYKWLVDALVTLGWLRGDAYKDISITSDQKKCSVQEEPSMEVTIEYEAR